MFGENFGTRICVEIFYYIAQNKMPGETSGPPVPSTQEAGRCAGLGLPFRPLFLPNGSVPGAGGRSATYLGTGTGTFAGSCRIYLPHQFNMRPSKWKGRKEVSNLHFKLFGVTFARPEPGSCTH